jgi:hypothetical protein
LTEKYNENFIIKILRKELYGMIIEKMVQSDTVNNRKRKELARYKNEGLWKKCWERRKNFLISLIFYIS